VRTEVVSRHFFRRTARTREHELTVRCARRMQEILLLIERNETPARKAGFPADLDLLGRTSYRVAKRRGGLRWVVEKVTR
jgi:hypothetical protein